MLVETVGSGQNEVEVQSLTETVVLALMPGSGDGVQAIKAGLMEIPDVLAVTKEDRAGADALVADLSNALSLVPAGPWEPPIVRVAALEDRGVDDLWDAVERHRAFLGEEGRLELGAATASRASFTRWRPTASRGGWRPRPTRRSWTG